MSKQIEINPKKLAAIGRKSFWFFCRVIMKNDWLTKEVHLDLCNFLQQDYPNKKLVELPRGFLKTTVASVYYPIWLAINNPSIRILLVQNTFENAAKRVHEIRSIFERNDLFKALYNEIVPNFNSKNIRWSNECAEVNRPTTFPEGTFESAGVGTKLTSRHYDCICRGNYVYTSNGLIKIEDIKKSMRVLTDDCSYSEVVNIAKKNTDKRIIKIQSWGQPYPLRCTEDHRIKVYRDNSMEWVEAKDVTYNDYLVLPIPKNRRVFGSRTNERINKLLSKKDIWRLIGYWLAEGAASEGNRIRLTFGDTENEYVEDVKNIVLKYLEVNVTDIKTKSSTIVVSFFDKDFKEILNKFGTHSYNKHLPPLALSTHYPNKVELIKGYLRGDGHKRNNNSIGWTTTSVSYSLIATLQLLLASLNIPSMISNGHKKGKNIVVGNICNTRKSYTLSINNPLIDVLMGNKTSWQYKPNRNIIIPDYYLQKIKSIVYTYDDEVYDLQVSKFHNFVVNGACVHNCIIEDDLVTADTHDLSGEEIAPNMEDVDKAIGWHKMATNLLIDYKTSKRIHIGTRWFQEDMINHIKTHEPGYARFLKTVYDEDGNAIYPKRFDDEVLDAKKEEMGTYMFATQMLLDPMPLEKMIFKPNWNRFFNIAPETKNVLAIDPAIGESKQNCDSGFAVVGGAPNGLIYIHEAFGKQMNLTEQVKITFKLVRDYNIHKVVVETIAYQEALAQAIALERDRVDEKGVKVNEDVHFSIVKEVPGGKDKKDARIKSMIPYFENGKVLMKKNMSKLQKQLREYPFGKKRDVIDVLAYAIRNAVHTKEFVKQKEVDPLSFEAIMKELEDKSKQNSLFPKAKGFVASGMSRYY